MENNIRTELENNSAVKKKRKKKEIKPIHELDEMLKITFKKERIGTKVDKEDLTEDFCLFSDIIDNLKTLKGYKYICIIDKLYQDNLLRFFIRSNDCYVIIVNDQDVYNKLKKELPEIDKDTRLCFFDEIEGLKHIN